MCLVFIVLTAGIYRGLILKFDKIIIFNNITVVPYGRHFEYWIVEVLVPGKYQLFFIISHTVAERLTHSTYYLISYDVDWTCISSLFAWKYLTHSKTPACSIMHDASQLIELLEKKYFMAHIPRQLFLLRLILGFVLIEKVLNESCQPKNQM